VIGGTHLGFLNSDDQLEKTMDAFDQYQLKLIAVSHCTGKEAAAACYNRFRERFAFAMPALADSALIRNSTAPKTFILIVNYSEV